MQILVHATHRDGHPGIWTPNTLWLSAKPTAIEVLEVDESPARATGPATDGMKIGRTELAELRKKDGLMIQGTDQSNAVEMTAQLAEANKRHAEEVAALRAASEQLAIEIQRLKPFEARVAEQEQTIADLRGRISRAGQPPQQGKQQDQPRR